MFTRDFSRAPDMARGSHMFFGGTRYRGLRALCELAVRWPGFARELRRSPGYCGHVLWYRFPFTFGSVSTWERREDMLAFARTSAHRGAVSWLTRPGIADAAFIRFLQADEAGHTIGSWRGEDDGDAWRVSHLPFSSTELGEEIHR
jgi:heme-degrading monooxygenase HmoA